MAAREVSWGDIRLVRFEHPDKTRPALVLARSKVIAHLSVVTVAPITRVIRGIATELSLGVAEGLKTDSVAKLDNLQTVRKDRLGQYIGHVDAKRKGEIRDALLFALDLD